MDSLRKTALVAGALYLITFATSIPARILFGPVRNDPNYILGPGADTQVLFAGLLDVILALACIGTAVALYPVVKRQNEGVALGLRRLPGPGSRHHRRPASSSLLSVVTLRQAGAGADALVTGQALVASYNWTFLFGPGFMAGVNALLLGSLLYRSGLVPRIIPLVGLIGAPLLFASDLAVMFGLWEQISLPAGIATRPDRAVGGLPRRLAGRQGFQALPDHSRHDRYYHPTRPPGRRRLTIDDAPWPGRNASRITPILLH